MTAALPPFSIDVTPESYCRWLVGRDDALPDEIPAPGTDVPLSYLFFLRCQPAAAISIHTELGRDPDRGLFGGVRYQRQAGIVVGDTLNAVPQITERKSVDSPRGELTLTTLVNQWHAGNERVVTETVRMIDLPPGPPSKPGDGPAADPELGLIGNPTSFSRRQIAWLTVETGDLNALHLDRDYATSRGFPDVVVPGTLIVPFAERMLTTALGTPLETLDVRFRAPTYPGEEITIAARKETEMEDWTFEISGGGTVRADGRARFAGNTA
jgi:hydroxyacyl-ACP dehydratase HTD2-like protein with hotdog domain